MDEQRLPFPIHGTRLSGDGDPARGVGEAARLLYFVNLIAETANVPVFQLSRQTPYGAVTASVHGPLAFKSVRADEEPEEAQEEPVQGVNRLVWLPEGFVITPRTAGAPDGFGMPPTPDGKGTPGGPLKQVVINRFKDNQYPDAVYRWAVATAAASPDATDDEIAAVAQATPGGTVFAANLFFMGWEMGQGEFGIGITVGDGDEAQFRPQFSQRWVPNYREPESGSWHCHRPQLELSQVPLEALAHQEVNLVREQVAMPALGRPLRGRGGELSQNIAYQIRTSGVFEHDSPLFADGHRSFSARSLERSAFAGDAGENLNLRAPARLDAEAVYGAIDGWVNSPGHYDNMTYDWADSGARYAWVDSAFAAAGNAVQPPTTGVVGVQIFHAADAAVDAAPGSHIDRPPVGVSGEQDMFVPAYPQAAPSQENFWPVITYRGRTLYVTEDEVNVHSFRVLSGTTLVEDGAETKLRIIALLRPQGADGPVYVVVYEGAVHDFLKTKQEVSRYQLPTSDVSMVARPQWSASGSKAIFCYTRVARVPNGRVNTSDWTADGLASNVFGQTVHFVEFRGGSFYTLYDEHLTITPLAFGVKHYSQECKGTCRLLAAYQGETPVYATVEFDGTSSQNLAVEGPTYNKSIKGVIHFPGGRSLTYVDIQISSDDAPEGWAIAHGFVRHLLPFDIMDPDGVAYVQYDLPAQDTDWLTASLMIRGTRVKFAQDPLRRKAPGIHGVRLNDPAASVGAHITTLSAHRGIANAASFTTHFRYSFAPSVPYHAVVVSYSNETAPRPMPSGPDPAIYGNMEYVLSGPVILAKGRYDMTEQYERVEEFQYCRYKDAWIYAGRIETTLGPVGTVDEFVGGVLTHIPAGAWVGDDQYYCHSSLDLKAITGLPDLKDNILPIGVL